MTLLKRILFNRWTPVAMEYIGWACLYFVFYKLFTMPPK